MRRTSKILARPWLRFLSQWSWPPRSVEFLVFLAEAAAVPAVFDVAEDFDADLVGVEVAGGHVDGAGVVVGVVDDFGGVEVVLGHDGGMPVGGPAFVHDFGHALGGEVVGFVADDARGCRAARVRAGRVRGGIAGRRGRARRGRCGVFCPAPALRRRRSSSMSLRGVDEAIHVALGLEAGDLALRSGDFGVGAFCSGSPGRRRV